MTMRFTIRDLLWLMVVVGMACGWWLDHRMTREDRELLHWAKSMGYEVEIIPAAKP